MQRNRALAGAAAVLAVAGCAGGNDASAPSPGSSTAEATTPTASETAAAPGGTRLRAVVGTSEDPDAYEITLIDASGDAVERLPAASYTIDVADLSRIHNFHLVGPDVDEATSVREVEDTTFQVTLRPGAYRFVCDPHPNMRGDFTVA